MCASPAEPDRDAMGARSGADAIVVLGCRVLPSGRPGPALARRAAVAAAAFHEGLAPRVVTSGGRRWGAVVEAHALSDELVRRGVPRAAIAEELWSLSTVENAVGSSAIVRRLAAVASPAVLVVTCAWHLPRAIVDFRAVGLDARPLPAVGPAAGIVVGVYRRVHERVCARLDDESLRRGRWLREGAGYACGVGRGEGGGGG